MNQGEPLSDREAFVKLLVDINNAAMLGRHRDRQRLNAELMTKIDQLEARNRELEYLQRTIEFMEREYLREHGGSWGKCKYQAEVEDLEARLRRSEARVMELEKAK